MASKNVWLKFALLFSYLMVCSSQNSAIQHLNMKFNRLNRITNGLQKDVDDIWTALSDTAVNSQKVVSNTTKQEQANSKDVMQLVNETVSDVKELKTEIEELVLYAKNGFKKEKIFNRDKMTKMTRSQNEFQTSVSKEISEMKSWQHSFQESQLELQGEQFEKVKLEADEGNKRCELMIQNLTNDFTNMLEESKDEVYNITNDYTVKLEENTAGIGSYYDKLASVEQKAEASGRQAEENKDEIALMKDVINEKLGHLLVLDCPDGWKTFERHCYYFSSIKKTWDEAHDFCLSMNSFVVQTETDEEINFVAETFQGYSLWLGGTDRDNEGKFTWQASKQPVAGNHWNKNEPNDANGNEDCIELICISSYFGKFNDFNCDLTKHFACERSMFMYK